MRAGALATLVDVIGGGLAATVAHPDWIATADLTLHLVGAATEGSVEARARVVHAGRTTVVIEVDLLDDAGAEIGIATMSFAVLPRRDGNPDVTTTMASGPVDDGARPARGMRATAARRARASAWSTPRAASSRRRSSDWSRNSLGAMQGGAVATVVDAAAEVAARAATERAARRHRHPAHATSRSARVGPMRTRVDVLGAAPGTATTHVELVDLGSGSRVTSVARVVATSSLRGGR